MAGRGGYREPSNAKRAAVSNPRSGKRTDGGMGSKQRQKMLEVPSNGEQGYRKETASFVAPEGLAGQSAPSAGAVANQQRRAAQVTPLTAPTTRPGEAVTEGASVGPGYTPESQFPERFAMINQYRDSLDTMAANAPEGFKIFMSAVYSQARNSE